MSYRRVTSLVLVSAILGAAPIGAQSAATDYRDEIMRHFEQSTRKLTSLAEAVPGELYTWRPGEGIMSIAQVYMHIARYNYMYPETSLGIAAPQEIDLDNLESITDKTQVTALLKRSVTHVRELAAQMSERDLNRPTMLYGREVPGWAVLLQLVAHMNEHVGQSVSYARMNNIVPPWSR